MKSQYEAKINELNGLLQDRDRALLDWQNRFNKLQAELGNAGNQSRGYEQ